MPTGCGPISDQRIHFNAIAHSHLVCVLRAFIENHSNTKIVIVIIFTSLVLALRCDGFDLVGGKWDRLALISTRSASQHSHNNEFRHRQHLSLGQPVLAIAPATVNKWKQFDKFLQLFLCWLAIFDEVSVPLCADMLVFFLTAPPTKFQISFSRPDDLSIETAMRWCDA